ncbi:hypothetical protein OROHE_020490 [Orobanche hederae]
MARSYGFRLASRSICYCLRRNTSSLPDESSLQGGFRNYGTNKFEVLNSNLGNAHLSTDYYKLLKERNYLTPSETKDACFEIATRGLDPKTFKDDPEAEKKFKKIEKKYMDLKDNKELDIFVEFLPGDEDMDIDDFVCRWQNVGEDVEVTDGLSNMEAIREFAKKLAIQTDLTGDTCGGTRVPSGTRLEAVDYHPLLPK